MQAQLLLPPHLTMPKPPPAPTIDSLTKVSGWSVDHGYKHPSNLPPQLP